MDSRLAEQLVEWHNRHPLARRISIFDVHTIGVVALPFMRSGRPAAPVEPAFEPPPPAEAAPEAPGPTADEEAAATPAAPEAPAVPPAEAAVPAEAHAAAAVAPPPAPAPKPGLMQRLRALLPTRQNGAQGEAGWPLFSERFINRLSPRRVANFALAHGHSQPPGAQDWPLRTIEIDEDLMMRTSRKAAGAWPVELYLITAGIDAGPARTRVLMAYGSGQRLQVLGRRCLDPKRLLLTLGLPALLLGGGAAAWWWSGSEGSSADHATAPATAASGTLSPAASSPAASMPAAAASVASVASAASAASEPASAPAQAASAPAEPAAQPGLPSAASAAASAATPAAPPSGVPFAPAPAAIPDIRPHLGAAPRLTPRASEAEARKIDSKGEAKSSSKSDGKAEAKSPSPQAGKEAVKPSAKPEDKATPARADSKPELREPAHEAAKPTPSKEETKADNPGKAIAAQSLSRGRVPLAATQKSGSDKPATSSAAAPESRQVALVGPASPSKAQAEATLERMRALLGQTVRDPGQLQGQVFKTQDGWRPAVWPFASREQAQLINATLIASGLRTKAVDF